MKFDLLVVGECVLLGEEGCAQGWLAVVIKFLVGEAGEDGGLADIGVAHCNQFELSYLAFALLLIFGHQ